MNKFCSFHEAINHEDLDQRDEIAFIRKKFVPLKYANINIMTNAFLFGTSCHDSLRGYYNDEDNQLYIFRMEDHYKRLKKNSKILNMDSFFSIQQMCDITLELLEKNNFKSDCYIRSIAYKSGLHFGLNLLDINDLAIFAVLQKRFHETLKPISVCISTWRRVQDNAIPARGKINGAYVNSSLAVSEAIFNGYNDAIFLNENGNVSEGTGMNLFMVKNNVIVTPPNYDNILEGITRETLIEIIPEDLKMKLEQRSINRSELYTADEIFFCGTGAEIVPVKSIDKRIIADGKNYPISKMIQEYYFNLVRGKNQKRKNWLTPVNKKERIYE